ncbi:MAG: hypothetical protein Q8K89_11120, partial [Actinomycetota bacterium]|nr:hypothetical protein [Actinomycetota bacterium]
AGLSTSNWNSGSSNSGNSSGLPAGWENVHSPSEGLQRGLDEAGKQLGVSLGTAEQWWVFLAFAVLTLLVVCIVLWAVGIAARGGLIAQTREAIAGRTTSVSAGWRAGLRLWGRVFAVGFLFALPFLGLGALGLITLAVFGVPALIAGGGTPAITAGLVGMGLVLSLIGLVGFAIGIIVSLLEEVALRHAVLDGQGALYSIKASWADLRAKRGVASMWLVMILVNIAAGLAAAIVVIPVVIVLAFVVAASVAAGGESMLWLIAPALLVLFLVGATLKAAYSTFRNTVWTSFYDRMQAPELGDAGPATLEPAAI